MADDVIPFPRPGVSGTEMTILIRYQTPEPILVTVYDALAANGRLKEQFEVNSHAGRTRLLTLMTQLQDVARQYGQEEDVA